MKELSLFSGAGGGLLGTKLLGFTPIGYVEWDDYCQRVLAARIKDGILPNAPIFGDIKTFISEGYAASYTGLVDVVTGGFPCQDISCAGSRKGIGGERSGLWKAMAQVIRIVRPHFAFVENSPGLLIRGLGTVLRDLAEMGFDARWGVLGFNEIGGQSEENEYGLLPSPTCTDSNTHLTTALRTRETWESTTNLRTRLLGLFLGLHGKENAGITAKKLHLNPCFVEMIMDWPMLWTELKPLEMDKFQQWLQQHGESLQDNK